MTTSTQTKPVQSATESKPVANSAWFKHSYAVAAILAIIFTDCTLRIANRWHHINPYDTPNRSFMYWAATGYRAQKVAPDIVLMGSSLMMAALHGADATTYHRSESALLHHRSFSLENDLKERFHTNFRTYGLAIGGQNASDAFLIASCLFHSDKKPKSIIYGIAPRDLMDSTLGSAATTETFKYLTHIHDTPDLAFPMRISMWEKADYFVEKASFIYNHKNYFLNIDDRISKFLISKLTWYKDLNNVYAPFYLRKIALTELPEDFGPNEVQVDPYDPTKAKFQDNLAEYRRRYAQINLKMLDDQLRYMIRLSKLCKQQGINLIFVNMPLTQDNMALLPKGIYAGYLDKIRELAQNQQCSFLDLNQPSQFPKVLFADSVHLNGNGGKHFFDLLSDQIFQNAQLARSMKEVRQ